MPKTRKSRGHEEMPSEDSKAAKEAVSLAISTSKDNVIIERSVRRTPTDVVDDDIVEETNKKVSEIGMKRSFDADWSKQYSACDFRYFATDELLSLFGFPSHVQFNASVTPRRKQYELIGNSLNIHVAAEVLKYGGVC